jgi:hypothetical protein
LLPAAAQKIMHKKQTIKCFENVKCSIPVMVIEEEFRARQQRNEPAFLTTISVLQL